MHHIVFRPTKDLIRTPQDIGLAFDDVRLNVEEQSIHGWYLPAADARAELLFFHGNSGNISHRLESLRTFHSLGLSVFIIDYRGYGLSEGRATIKRSAADARAAWEWLTKTRKVPPEKIILFGRSLGGAVAMELTRQVTPGALILESTFSSLPDMIRIDLLSPLARLLVGNVWNSVSSARNITVPTLCIHSPEDEIVPYRLGRRLFDAIASDKKSFLEIHGSHNNGWFDSYDPYRAALEAFLEKTFPRPELSKASAGQ